MVFVFISSDLPLGRSCSYEASPAFSTQLVLSFIEWYNFLCRISSITVALFLLPDVLSCIPHHLHCAQNPTLARNTSCPYCFASLQLSKASLHCWHGLSSRSSPFVSRTTFHRSSVSKHQPPWWSIPLSHRGSL
uniref:Uncharacterized protein n=1 Tax=Octopus bimaculoides TaxID=37653 RepID=A0A0L8H1B5_OCTBM